MCSKVIRMFCTSKITCYERMIAQQYAFYYVVSPLKPIHFRYVISLKTTTHLMDYSNDMQQLYKKHILLIRTTKHTFQGIQINTFITND